VLDTGLFTGAVTVAGSDPERQHHLAVLLYTDVADPLGAYTELQQHLAAWAGTEQDFPHADRVRTVLHSSMYCNSIGNYDYYA
jgi:hypothetical protein